LHLHSRCPQDAGVDYLVMDEGEITLPYLVDALSRGVPRGRFTAAGEIQISPQAPFLVLIYWIIAYAMMTVQFSRGCPFQYKFCDIIVLFGRKPLKKTPGELIAERDSLQPG
jgi:radical SAM superfamily enzyme YgiQ (UPF0313 family)